MSKVNKFNNFFNKFIYIFLLLSPVLDALTAICVKKFNLSFSIGTIVRGIFLLLSFVWLKYNSNRKKIIILFLLYTLLAIIYFFGLFKGGIFNEIINIFHIFYLPIVMLLFSKYNNDKINDKLVVKIFLLYLNLIIIPYLFNIGYNLTESYVNKQGYFGLFFGGNELSAVLVLLSIPALNYVNNSKSYILKIITYLELIICIFLVGTKTLFVGIILVIIFLFIRYIKYSRVFKVERNRRVAIWSSMFIIVLLIGIIPFTPMMKNIKTTLKYYNVNKVSDVLNIKTIDNVVFSKRLSNAKKINDEYMKSDINGIIYGLGETKIESINVIEIDILDIFYSIGIFGTIVFILMILYTSHFYDLRDKYKFAFILLVIISLVSGHVLNKPMVSIYLGLLYLLSKNSLTLEKKSILLVSNMYPSKNFKHYGSFVKNSYELLKDSGYIVDKVVMHKQTNKFMKLIAYSRLHLLVILKSIFNNYDYIYVHYISHSSLGAVIAKKLSFNVKLVLNAHGNDVVMDVPSEIKNVNRSKKFIKEAYKVIVPSKYYQEVIEKEYGVNKEDITVYPSGGVNTGRFNNIDMLEAKKEVNLNTKYNYIGYVSRIEKDKGYDIFLKAAAILKDNKDFKNYKYLVVGGGAEEDIFNNLVKELGLEDYLEVRNFVSQDELVNIYNSLDVFVFPTYRKSESLGLVGLEAMSCETLVVASNNYGPTSYVVNKKNGLLFKPKDEKDLANKIIEMKKMNKEEVKKMKTKARETAIKYDAVNTKNILVDVFK